LKIRPNDGFLLWYKTFGLQKSSHFEDCQTDFEQLKENCISGSWFNFACIVNLRINEREFCRKFTVKRDSSCRQYTEKCDSSRRKYTENCDFFM